MLYQIGLFSNKPHLGAVVLTFVLQLAVIYVPFLQGFFNTVPLSALDLAIGLAISSIIFWVVELAKWLKRPAKESTPVTGRQAKIAPSL